MPRTCLPFFLLLSCAARQGRVPERTRSETRPPLVLTAEMLPRAKDATEPLRELASQDVPSHDPPASHDPSPAREKKSPPKRILVAGDSMTGALGLALASRFRPIHVEVLRDTWVSVGIGTYAKSSRFAERLQSVDPDLVLVVLGANDAEIPHPTSLVPSIHRIVELTKGRACYWIGPPMWKQDRGIVDVLQAHTERCVFVDSRNLRLKRKDGIHPSLEGARTWAEHLWNRLSDDYAFPSELSEKMGP